MKSRTAIIGAGLTGLSCARVLRRASPYVELFEADHIIGVRMAPCWSLMVRLDDRSLPDADVYSDMSDVMSWVARDSTKPGRNTRGETIFVQASSSWSRETEDVDPEVLAEQIWGELSYVFNLPPVRPSQMNTHLWRYGLVEQALGENFVYSKAARVGVAGDWCLGRIAEHAYESGHGLGRAIAASVD